jgi:hypothetical protein
VNQITALNDATRNLAASPQAQIVSLNNLFATYKRTSEETLIKLADSNQGLVEQLQDLPRQVELALAGGLVQQPINPPPLLTHHHLLLPLLLLLLQSLLLLICSKSSKNRVMWLKDALP